MADYTHWFVRAVTAVPGINAIYLATTLTPGMRGRMLCAAAEAAAIAGDVTMLSPGGLDALAALPRAEFRDKPAPGAGAAPPLPPPSRPPIFRAQPAPPSAPPAPTSGPQAPRPRG